MNQLEAIRLIENAFDRLLLQIVGNSKQHGDARLVDPRVVVEAVQQERDVILTAIRRLV